MSANTSQALRDAATPIVIVGHVDHGKSTLIGRLLYDTDSLPEGRVSQIVESSRKRGLKVEWSFLLDSLQIERDQGVTVDSTRIPFRLGSREFVIVDAPGHRQFLRNMITGAADAEAAVLVVDAAEGAQEQTRRHAMLLRLIGISHVIVLMNKVDTLDYDEAKIRASEESVADLLKQLGITVSVFVPASAREGDNIAQRSENMAWYEGPTLTEALKSVPSPSSRTDLALRLPVQDVYRFDDKRLVVGRIERGRVKIGDSLVIGTHGTVAKVAAIESWHTAPQISAVAGQSVALVLEPDVIPDRGDLLHPPSATPIKASRIRTRLFWLRQEPLRVGESFRLRLSTAEHQVTVASIDSVVNLDDLTEHASDQVPPEGFAEITLAASENILFDAFQPGTTDGRGVLVDRHQRIVAGAPLIGPAQITTETTSIHPTGSTVTASDRARAKGHRGGVFWLTGLPGSGKSTIARATEKALFTQGIDASVVDGDTLRAGLCADLGFSDKDRRENIRRAASVARILAETGQVVIVALVSPSAEDRALARQIVGDEFQEVHIDADVSVCEARDPKGLYAAARAGRITGFTGVDAPYDVPLEPNLHIATAQASIDDAVAKLSDHIRDVVTIGQAARLRS